METYLKPTFREVEKKTGRTSGVFVVWDFDAVKDFGFSNIAGTMLPIFRYCTYHMFADGGLVCSECLGFIHCSIFVSSSFGH